MKPVLAQYTLNYWQKGYTSALNINMFCCIQYYMLPGLLDRKHVCYHLYAGPIVYQKITFCTKWKRKVF